MKKSLYFGKRSLGICISRFIHQSKMIRDKYPNCPKSHKIDKLVLIAEAKYKIRRNSGVSNIYTFLHAYFGGVEFYATRKYVNLTKEGREEDFFVNEEEEEEYEVMPVSQTPLVVEQRVGGV